MITAPNADGQCVSLEALPNTRQVPARARKEAELRVEVGGALTQQPRAAISPLHKKSAPIVETAGLLLINLLYLG